MTLLASVPRVTAYRGKAPGVYVEAQTRQRMSGLRRTDIAGFVGVAARGPTDRAVRLESWASFVDTFGKPLSYAHLGFAVRGFFANGGRTCWVVRVAAPGTPPASAVLGNGLRVLATSVGEWGNDLSVTVTPEPDTLGVGSEARRPLFRIVVERAGRLVDDLRMIDLDAVHEPKAPHEFTTPSDFIRLMSFKSETDEGQWSLPARPKLLRLKGGRDRPKLHHAEDLPELHHAEDFLGSQDDRRGLILLEEVDEVSILAMPDIMMPNARAEMPPDDGVIRIGCRNLVSSRNGADRESRRLLHFSKTEIARLQHALVEQAERLRDRFAILDPAMPAASPDQVESP